jgi:thiol:disulfide interchange protein DsbD
MHRTLTFFLTALLVALSAWVAAPAGATEPPFSASVEPLTLAPSGAGAVTLTIAVPPGAVIYRDQVEVSVVSAGELTAGEPSLPPPLSRPDPYTGLERELYDLDVLIEFPVVAPPAAGEQELMVEARWQGCMAGICYLPQTELLTAKVSVLEKEAALARPAPLPLLLAGALVAPAGAAELSNDSPVAVSVSAEEDALLVAFEQLEGWHMTEMMTFIELAEGQAVALGEQGWPEAHQAPDPAIPGATRGEFEGDFTVRSDLHGPEGAHTVVGTVGYQACQAEKCLLPQYFDFELEVKLTRTSAAPGDAAGEAGDEAGDEEAGDKEAGDKEAGAGDAGDAVTAPAVATAAVTASASPTGAGALDSAAEKGVIWLVLFVMGAGFLVSLTPCVLPMVPITMGIIGAASSGNRMQGLLLSLTYVAGLALVYTGLGVFAAMTGSLFGGWMQSVWVVGAVAAFFAIMGVSMFGFFDVAVPSSIATRLSQKGGAGFGGAFVVGMVGGVVAGPCSGPVIASLMVLIGQQGEVGLGAALMLAFSLGMGLIFIVAGTFSSLMLQPGMWMDTVKKFFGVLLWLGAIYYVAPHLSEVVTALLVAFVLLSTAAWSWPRSPDMEGETLFKMKRVYGVIGGIIGGYLLVGALATQGFILQPLSLSAGGGEAVAAAGPAWRSDEGASLAYARENNLPVLIDFTADWCAACKELEHFTYTDPRVIALSEEFVPVMIDATSDKDPEVAALLKKYNVNGLPTVKFLGPDGEPFEDLTLTGFIPADEFLPLMEAARGRAR